MLQMKALGAEAHDILAGKDGFPPKWGDMAELEKTVDAWIVNWLATRGELARKKGLVARICNALDQLLRTYKPEHLDDPEYPVEKKAIIIKGLHRFNTMYRSYPRYVQVLTPLIREIHRREKRPARLLELASGSFDLAMEMAVLSKKSWLPVSITGSDYIPEYVDQAKTRAKEREIEMDFKVVNAFEMESIVPGDFDIVALSQAAHHFTPGQLAVIIARARDIATTAFVSIDAVRSINNLLGVVPFPLLTFQFGLLHDAWLSARKYFSDYELQNIANIAAPGSSIGISHTFPVGCLTVRFDQGDVG